MKYLLTGASGFLGRHILEVLPQNSVITLGRTSNNAVVTDLSESIPTLLPTDVVIHCAGKAHTVPKTPEEENEFFQVNLIGTRNLLKGLEKLDKLPSQIIFISTVSVYGRESGDLISESQPLVGGSPYALSKIQTEQLLLEWGETHDVPVLILRLPLIVGSNPPGNLGKMINGIKTGRYASIAGGKARKSMVLASDVAQLISKVLRRKGTYNLTDGYHPFLHELESSISIEYKSKIRIKLSLKLAKTLARIGDVIPFIPINSRLIDKMILDLTFDDSKAIEELNWSPNPVLGFKFRS